MKNTKKLLAILLSLIMLLGIMPLSVFAETPELTPMYVGGVQMGKDTYLAEGASAITTTKPSGGYAYLAADGTTLTLHNYNYIGAGYLYYPEFGYSAAIKWMGGTDDIVIVLEGNNTITSTDYGIEIDGKYSDEEAKLAIRGSGSDSLTVNASANGISADGLTISNCAVTVDSGNIGIIGGSSFTETGGIIIINSKVKVLSNSEAMKGYDAFYITNSIVEAYSNARSSFFNHKNPVEIVPTYTNGYTMKAGSDEASAVEVEKFNGEQWFKIEPIGGIPDTPVIPETPETPHVHNLVSVPGTAATCTTPGATASTICVDCGAIILAQTPIAALGHSFGAWTASTAASCTAAGEKTRSCSRCGETETMEVATTGHNPVALAAVPATCETDGLTAGSKCADCGAILEAQQTVDALGHNGVWKIDYEPTADHDGQMSCYCTRCNFCLESEVIERHKHDEGYEVISIAPTCTEKGEAKVICTVCGECIGTKEIEALGHDEGAWTASIAPTCMVKGEEICTCTRCGKVTDKKAIEAIGHDYSAWYTNNDGTHSKTCSICQDIQTANCAYRDEIHAPECATEGYTKHICDDCGYYYVDSFVPALGHDVVFTDAGDGTHIMTCNDCTITEVQGHVFGEWVYNEDGKFFKNGTKSRICDDCGCIETEEAKHTKWISHPFYPIIVWMGNVVHKILKVLSFDWFMPEITYKPSI